MKTKLLLLCVVVILSVGFWGCGKSYEQNNYVIEMSRNRPPLEKKYDRILLEVSRYRIAPEFDTKHFVYRKGRSEFETDFYNCFFINPDEMITEKTRRWLSESGLFAAVLEPASLASPTHILHGEITELYGDFRNKMQPQAQVAITFHLSQFSDRSIVFEKAYNVASKIEKSNAEGVIDAYDLSIKRILSDLESDLESDLQRSLDKTKTKEKGVRNAL